MDTLPLDLLKRLLCGLPKDKIYQFYRSPVLKERIGYMLKDNDFWRGNIVSLFISEMMTAELNFLAIADFDVDFSLTDWKNNYFLYKKILSRADNNADKLCYLFANGDVELVEVFMETHPNTDLRLEELTDILIRTNNYDLFRFVMKNCDNLRTYFLINRYLFLKLENVEMFKDLITFQQTSINKLLAHQQTLYYIYRMELFDFIAQYCKTEEEIKTLNSCRGLMIGNLSIVTNLEQLNIDSSILQAIFTDNRVNSLNYLLKNVPHRINLDTIIAEVIRYNNQDMLDILMKGKLFECCLIVIIAAIGKDNIEMARKLLSRFKGEYRPGFFHICLFHSLKMILLVTEEYGIQYKDCMDDIAESLLENGINDFESFYKLKQDSISSECKNRLFRSAIKKSCNSIIKLLLKCKKVNPASRSNFAIVAATEVGNYEIVKLLMNHPVVEKSLKSYIPDIITECISKGHLEILRLILTKYPFEIDGYTLELSLDAAISKGYLDIIKAIVKIKAELLYIQTYTITVFSSGSIEIVRYFVEVLGLAPNSNVFSRVTSKEVRKYILTKYPNLRSSYDKKEYHRLNKRRIELRDMNDNLAIYKI